MVGIYKITSPTKRVYIGQSVNIEHRKDLYSKKHCKSQFKLYNSILKYGWGSHKFEIIEECKRGELNERELYWGKFFNTLDQFNLNLRLGNARGGFSKESLDKMKQNNLGVSRNKGVAKSKEHKEKLSKAVKNRVYTSERLNLMRESMLGKNTKGIICVNTNKKFVSIRGASKELNINERVISNNLLGYTKKTKNNLQFKYINI